MTSPSSAHDTEPAGTLDNRTGRARATRWAERGRLLALLLPAVILFGPLLARDQIPFLGDLCHLFYPGYVFMREALLDGTLPLWNPYMACGEPFLAHIQRGVFYPPNLLYLVLPTTQAIVVVAALHVAIAMIGVYALCRVWRISGAGSLMAAVGYGWSSYLLTKVAFPSELGSACWLPWVLAAFAWLVERPSPRRVALLALAIAMQFLAGFPETVLYTVFCLGLYAIRSAWVAWRRGRRGRALARPFLWLAAGGLVSLLLVAPQLLPTKEAMSLSERSATVDPQLDASSIHPMSVFTLLIPSLYGTDSIQGAGFWAPSCIHYSCGTYFLGVVPMMALLMVGVMWLAGLGHRDEAGLPTDRPKPPVVFLLVVLLIFFFYSMGRHSPFFDWCWHAIPLLQRFTWPSKCLFAVTLSLACLSAVALDATSARAAHAVRHWSRFRLFLARWLPVLVALAAGTFVVLCLTRNRELGVWILRRYFNFDAIDREYQQFVPWVRIGVDCVKFAVVALASVLLMRAYAFGSRRRGVTAAMLILLLGLDLYISNSYLLAPGPSEAVEGPSNYKDVLRPPGKLVRFFGMENTFRESVQQMMAKITTDARIIDCPFENLDGGETPGGITLVRIQRDMMSIAWPMADRAFDLKSNSNFVPAEVNHLTSFVAFPEVPSHLRRRLLSMLNCDRIVLPVAAGRFLTGRDKHGVRVAVFGQPMPRAFVVGGLEVIDDPNEVLKSVLIGPYDPWSRVKTDRRSADQAGLTRQRVDKKIPHRLTDLRYDHNRVSLKVSCAEPGILVLIDTYYPGWRATVNDESRPIFRANGAFRGIEVDRGENVVELTYWPTSLTYGLVGSGVGLVVTVGLLVYRLRSRAG